MSDQRIQKVIDDMVEDEMRGCVMCGSHVDLVYCQGIESIVTGRDLGLLCFTCRKDACYTDEGLPAEEAIAEAVKEALLLSEDEWDENDDDY